MDFHGNGHGLLLPAGVDIALIPTGWSRKMFEQILESLPNPDFAFKSGSGPEVLPATTTRVFGTGNVDSVFPVSDLAQGSILAAVNEVCRLSTMVGADPGRVTLDRRLCSLWFAQSLRPSGWQLPPLWDPVAGDYATRDGWIRLHTNAPAHRRAALQVLGLEHLVPSQGDVIRQTVADKVQQWDGLSLQDAVVNAGGCAAEMLSDLQWREHEQGMAVASEPLIQWNEAGHSERRLSHSGQVALQERLLGHVKVLDLTRVLAGPVCTRFLACFGAQVLRIDPFDWDELQPTMEMSVGKRRAGLDLKQPEDLDQLKRLLKDADVLVHGYRPDALENLGLGAAVRASLNPGLIDVSLCAYGWSGPWAKRRGFDSLVQMSCGIAEAGMRWKKKGKPHPLPVQALDHATGYLMAAATLNAINHREQTGVCHSARLSLARTARLLMEAKGSGVASPAEPHKQTSATEQLMGEMKDSDFIAELEATHWGHVQRLKQPFTIEKLQTGWQIPAGELRVDAAEWWA